MTDDNTRDELAQLRARVAQLEAGQRPKTRHRRLRRFLPLLIAGLLVALMPMSILAATPFLDLNGGPDHADANANIDLIFNAGITKGCTPTEYCPNDFVNREQMASFLARTAGLGANPPIANAKTAQTAANANTVGGYSPSGLVRIASASGPTLGSAISLTAINKTDASVTMQAPGPGYILLIGTLTYDAFNNNCDCEAQTDLVKASGPGGFSSPTQYTRVGQTANSATQAAVTISAFDLAPTSGTYTYTLVSKKAGGTGAVRAFNSVLTALYVPFSGTGTTP